MKNYFFILLFALISSFIPNLKANTQAEQTVQTGQVIQVEEVDQSVEMISCFYLLGFVIFFYVLFCMKRKGAHILTIGWLLGNGYYILCIYLYHLYGSYYKWYFNEICSWRAVVWFWAAILLFILGKEIVNFYLSQKNNFENQKELINQWKSLKYKNTNKYDIILLLLSFSYLLSCVFVYYKHCPQYMRLFTGTNGVYFRDLNKFFHPCFYCATFSFSAFLMFKAFLRKQYNVYFWGFFIVLFAILFQPQGKTYAFSLFLLLLFPFIFYSMFFNAQLTFKKFVCLFLILLCSICYAASKRKGFNGFIRLSSQSISTLYFLKQENKTPFGLFFTKRMLFRVFGIEANLPSFGTYCAYSLSGRKIDLNSEFKNNEWSFSCNYIGQADVYFGTVGMLCFFILGVLFGLLDFFICKNRKYIAFTSCFYMFFSLASGAMTFSAFESSLVKSGLFFVFLYIVFIEFYNNKIAENSKNSETPNA